MIKLIIFVPSSTLLYKCFIKLHQDYGDVISDKPNLSSLTNNIESVQCNAALAMTGTIKGISKDKL